MKQKISTVMAVLLMFVSVIPVWTKAAPLPLRVEVNGERIYFPDEEPYVDKFQRVQVPVRFVSEALGAKVDWTAATKTVTIGLDTDTLVLVLGQKTYQVNGEKKQMDTKAARTGGRTFVPLRFVSEGLGASVKWDSSVRTVYISTSGFAEDYEKPEEEPNEQDQNEIVEETIHGFKVKHNTGSNLRISKGSGEGNQAILSLSIRFWYHGETDYDMQVKEVEEILSQKIEKSTVEAVIKYVKTKTKEEQELEVKTFEDKNYEILVGSSINSNIGITVHNK